MAMLFDYSRMGTCGTTATPIATSGTTVIVFTHSCADTSFDVREFAKYSKEESPDPRIVPAPSAKFQCRLFRRAGSADYVDLRPRGSKLKALWMPSKYRAACRVLRRGPRGPSVQVG